MASHTSGGGSGGGGGGSGSGGGGGGGGAVDKGVLDDLTGTISSLFTNIFGISGVDLNKITSLANPEMKDWAKILSGKAKGYFHEDSAVRSKTAERVFGWVSAGIEKTAEGKNPLTKAALQKLADFVEMFVEDFCEKDGAEKEEEGKPSKGVDPDLIKKLGAVKASVAKANQIRIAKAKDAELPALLKRLELEAEGNARVEQIQLNGLPKPPKPPTPPRPPGVPIGTKMLGALKKGSDAVDNSGVLQPVNQGLQDLADWFNKLK